MKKIKNNVKRSGEHQADHDYCERIIDDLRRFMHENERLSAQLDIVLSSIEGGCSYAEADFLRRLNPGFLADMNDRQALMDSLMSEDVSEK